MGEVQLVTAILGQFVSLVRLVIYLLPQQLDMLVEIEAKRCRMLELRNSCYRGLGFVSYHANKLCFS